MPDVWVIWSTVRLNESLEMARRVLKTPARLAIAVHEDENIFDQLKEIHRFNPGRLILELGNYSGQVEAVNEICGRVRDLEPSNNILFVALPDDMHPTDGWYGAFIGCFNRLKDGIGVLAGYDGHGVSGFVATSAKYCDIYQKGWIHCPEYIHWWVDHELMPASQAHGKYFRCKGANAYHKMLDTQLNIRNPNWRKDNTTLNRRRKLMFSYKSIEEAPWRHWK